jgi:predicted cupin superfamily sugar epimerase
MDASEVAARFDLEPLPVEGGFFRQVWRSPVGAERPAGTAIIAMLTDAPDGFSQFHRLPTDELWHFYGGDPLELVLLEAGGTSMHTLLGADLAAGHVPVAVVVAGTWMAARTTGRWSLFGATMAPGFTDADYEGADAATLLAGWPSVRDDIRSLIRPSSELRLRSPDT